MKRLSFLKILFASVLFSTTSSITHAHVVWLEKSSQQNYPFVVKFGHEETETYPEHKMKSIQTINNQGQLISLKPHFIHGEAHIVDPQGAIVFLEFDNGVWSQQPNGKFVEKSRSQDVSLKNSTHHLKLGKNILLWNDAALANYHQSYELIPLSKPHVGQPLSLQILHQGKAVQGITVTDGVTTQQSNSQGVISLPVRKGDNRWLAVFEEPSANTKEYDRTKIEYLFSFNMP